MRFRLITIVFVALLATLAAVGQDRPVATSSADAGQNLPMQRVGPEDLLSLQVYDAPEFTRSVRVAADGTIRLPMMKTPIRVQGLFPNEIEAVLTDALKKEGLFIDPFVTVNISEYHSRPISVSGAVKSPMIFQAIGTVSLLDAITRAGGLTESAGADIIITRPNGSPDAQSVQRVPIKALLEGLDASLNIKLTGGEELRVPEVGKMVVEGNIAKPGVYPVLDPTARNTVSTAIAQAGGLSQYADHTAYIYRADDQGVTHTIEVPLWDILNRRKPDMTLQARDILHVPDSPKRRMTQTAIQTLTGVGATATTGLLIYRH
jgi:polysaccharide export outer membrane protein